MADMASAEEELARGTAVGDGGEITVEAGCRYESAYEEYTAKIGGVTGARVASCDIIGSAVLCEEINTATREYVWNVAAL